MAALDNNGTTTTKKKTTTTSTTATATASAPSSVPNTATAGTSIIPLMTDSPQWLPQVFADVSPVHSEAQLNSLAESLAQLQQMEKWTHKGDQMREKALAIVTRMASSRVDQVKAIGNAIMKQVSAGVDMQVILESLPQMKEALLGTKAAKVENKVTTYSTRLREAAERAKAAKETTASAK